jgi:phosphoribosyl 1,2-cyclic phosphodiesterase
MLTFSLQSGSNGNSIYVEAGDAKLLFDAGISGKMAQGRMRVRSRDISACDALLISHDHADHIRCAGVYQRKFGLPIYMTEATFHACRCNLGPLRDVRFFKAGETLQFADVSIHTHPTPHDAADGVAFTVEHGRRRLGIMTDLGHAFKQLPGMLESVDAAFLESNYDPDLLASGPYPYYLKTRISGQRGHLSNQEAAELTRQSGSRLQWMALAHLSEDNNDVDTALATHALLGRESLELRVASRYDVSHEWVVE